MPTDWAILTEPIFPDLIKICSAVNFDGIFSSYSLIWLLAHFRLFGKLSNSVSGLITFSFNPDAIVKVLKTDPSS